MVRETTTAVLACVVTFVLCAVAYPAVVWGVAWAVFPHQAEGSLIKRDGKVIGSELVAQPFASDKYFQPRPSAVDYKADATGGSNLGTKNPDQLTKVADRAKAFNATEKNPVPVELVMASGGGLDPHITPEGAYYQVPKVAAARGMSEADLKKLVDEFTETSGELVGAPARVNVLLLNLELDKQKPAKSAAVPAASPGAPSAQPAPSDGGRTETIAQPSTASGGAHAEVKAGASTAVTPQADARLARLRDALDQLSNRVDALSRRAAAGAPAGVATKLQTELRGLRDQVGTLADSSQQSARLSGKVDRVEGQVSSISRAIDSLRSDVKALSAAPKLDVKLAALGRDMDQLRSDTRTIRERLEKLRPESAPAASTGARTGDRLDLQPHIAAFKAGRFSEAADGFRSAANAHPDDARAWYFAAIANGLATRKWDGLTEELVTKGMERERAGSPPTAVIDAAFSDLTKATGKDWLAYYRQRAAGR
jgi:K+-transporting ATPase ATPase C chain